MRTTHNTQRTTHNFTKSSLKTTLFFLIKLLCENIIFGHKHTALCFGVIKPPPSGVYIKGGDREGNLRDERYIYIVGVHMGSIDSINEENERG